MEYLEIDNYSIMRGFENGTYIHSMYPMDTTHVKTMKIKEFRNYILNIEKYLDNELKHIVESSL